MSVKNPPGTFWPSERQEMLLTAALADTSAAIEAWRAVRPRISIDELELGSFELLPLIYRNLMQAGHDDVDLPRLKGVHRRTWVRNNLLVERTSATSEAFADDALRVEFVEGVMIATRFYGELGLRPTSLLDVLVGAQDESKALGALARAGWKERENPARTRGVVRFVFDGEGNVCVLRTTLAPDQTPSGAWLWEPGERHPVGDAQIPVPPPTETLFATCVLHARAEARPNIQWIVDAKMVLQADIDWQRLFVLAVESGQVPRLRDALAFLARLPGPKPPQDICDRLARTPLSRRQRLSYRCTTGSIRGAGQLPVLVAEHLAATTGRSSLGTIAAFPRFLRDRWGVARTGHVPLAAVKRAVRLLGNRGRPA